MSECISDCCTCVCERLQNNLVRNVHITTVCVCLGSEILFNFVSTEARDLYLLEGHHVKLDIHETEEPAESDSGLYRGEIGAAEITTSLS